MSAPRATPDLLTVPDHPPLTTLDRLAALAARLLAVPLALVCLGDEEAQARSETVCAVAALSEETYAIMTSIGDRRLLADPAVARAYFAYHAGVPVCDAAGRTLGAVYVMDRSPRAPSARDAALLEDVAALAADQLQTHRALRSLADADVALRSVAQATAALTGAEYCRALVAALTQALRVDYAFVAEVADDAGARARMVALHANGTVVDDIEYALRGTPCHEVVADGICIVPSGARQRYPEDTLLSE